MHHHSSHPLSQNPKSKIQNPKSPPRPAYTLIELLVATALALLLLVGVVQVFATVSNSISNAPLLEKSDQLRATRERLILDVQGILPPIDQTPPLEPGNSLGYFQYTEGPIGPVHTPGSLFVNADMSESDSTVGDVDDMLMCTVRSPDRPFIGRVLQKRSPLPGETAQGSDDPDGAGPLPVMPYIFVRTAESVDAEVAWWLRGRTLYRRLLLVISDFDADLRTSEREMQLVQSTSDPTIWTAVKGDVAGPRFFAHYDLSVHLDTTTTPNTLVPNTLADLTKPENRFAHRTWDLETGGAGGPNRIPGVFPFHPHSYYEIDRSPDPDTYVRRRTAWSMLGLPTAREMSFIDSDGTAPDLTWNARIPIPMLPLMRPVLPSVAAARDSLTARAPLDLWTNPHCWQELDPMTGSVILDAATGAVTTSPAATDPFQGSRVSEDVILTNVLSFDVKVWDPNAPVLVRDYGSGQNPRYVTLLPGDSGYRAGLATYCQNIIDGDPPNPSLASLGAYVDLNYMCRLGPQNDPGNTIPAYLEKPRYWDVIQITGMPEPYFYGPGEARSQLRGQNPNTSPPSTYDDLTTWPFSSVYDTWSTHFELDGINQDRDTTPVHTVNPGPPPSVTTTYPQLTDEATNGFDDDQGNFNDDPATDNEVDENPLSTNYPDQDGIVDGMEELETLPPYSWPIAGLQIKIRVYEPDSRQIREVTVIHEPARQ